MNLLLHYSQHHGFAGSLGPQIGTLRPEKVGKMAEADLYKDLRPARSWKLELTVIVSFSLLSLRITLSKC